MEADALTPDMYTKMLGKHIKSAADEMAAAAEQEKLMAMFAAHQQRTRLRQHCRQERRRGEAELADSPHDARERAWRDAVVLSHERRGGACAQLSPTIVGRCDLAAIACSLIESCRRSTFRSP